MTEDEIKICRKIAVQCKWTTILLLIVIFTFLLLPFAFSISMTMGEVFGLEDITLAVLLFAYLFFVIVPYVACVVRLSRLTEAGGAGVVGCLCMSIPILLPIFTLILLVNSWRMLEKMGYYKKDCFKNDSDSFSEPSRDFQSSRVNF